MMLFVKEYAIQLQLFCLINIHFDPQFDLYLIGLTPFVRLRTSIVLRLLRCLLSIPNRAKTLRFCLEYEAAA